MSPLFSRLSRASVAVLCSAFIFSAAVPASADAPPADPGVARLGLLTHEVDVTRADSGDVFAATLNTPLSIGDDITTLDDAYAEIQFDYAASLRVAPDTQLRFTQLDPGDHVAQLAQGSVDMREFRGLDAHPEIDTPGAAIRPGSSGSVRVTVDGDGNTEVTVRAGQADVTAAASTQTVTEGTSVMVTGSGDGAQIAAIGSVPLDAFDTFNNDRDAYLERFHDQRYVDAGLVGADDLDGYGHWIATADYGQVWVPDNQDDGWAPYHSGRWVWEPYYGWTWVAAEPWGWAPYHYGNWFYAAGTGWCWYPGSYAAAAPVYRPALVAFFSFGGGNIGVSFGNVGWVPIAPGEPFHPWWGYGGVNTTVINTTVVNNYIYRNGSAPGGAVAVTNGSFSRGNFSHVTPVTPEQFAAVEPVRGLVPIVPTSRNLGFDGAKLAPLETTSQPGGRFAGFAPPAAAPKPFALQRAAVAGAASSAYPERAQTFEQQLHPDAAKPDVVKPEAAAPGDVKAPDARPDPFARFSPAPAIENKPAPAPGYARPATAAPYHLQPAAKPKKHKPKPAPSP